MQTKAKSMHSLLSLYAEFRIYKDRGERHPHIRKAQWQFFFRKKEKNTRMSKPVIFYLQSFIIHCCLRGDEGEWAARIPILYCATCLLYLLFIHFPLGRYRQKIRCTHGLMTVTKQLIYTQRHSHSPVFFVIVSHVLHIPDSIPGSFTCRVSEHLDRYIIRIHQASCSLMKQ
jgi:hypothetical protein